MLQRPSLLDGVERPQAKVFFRDFAEEAAYLRKVVDHYSGDLLLREIALRVIFPSCRPKDEPAQAIRIGQWVQDRTHYIHDPPPQAQTVRGLFGRTKVRMAARELFQRPMTTIRLRAGDCDDYTVLIASMLGCVGIPSKLCILKLNGRWAHIFPVAIVRDGGKLHRMTLDGTLVERSTVPPFEPVDDPIGDLVNPIAVCKARGDLVEPYFV